LPNLNLLDGIPLVNNFDPLLPKRYATWLGWMESAESKLAMRWLTLAGTEAELIIDLQDVGKVKRMPLPANPRVGWIGCAESSPSPQAAFDKVNERLMNGINPGCLVVEGENLPASASQLGEEGSVTLLKESPNRIMVSVNSTIDGWVVIRDSWYPGWQAVMDGQSIPILHADYLFKAVHVSAGNHEIALEYKPVSFTIGLWVSVFAWVVFGICWLYLRRNGNKIPD